MNMTEAPLTPGSALNHINVSQVHVPVGSDAAAQPLVPTGETEAFHD